MIKPLLAFKCMAAAGLILAAAGLSRPVSFSRQPQEPVRDICEEVAHELNLAYIDGRIERSEAIRIIDRCFELYS